MSATFRTIGHKASSLLDVTLEGLFDDNEAERLRVALIGEIKELGCEPGAHRSLFDITRCKIQPQIVVARLRDLSDKPGWVARKLAIVVGPSLMRMQLRRIVGEERVMQTFDDRASALSWLLRTS